MSLESGWWWVGLIKMFGSCDSLYSFPRSDIVTNVQSMSTVATFLRAERFKNNLQTLRQDFICLVGNSSGGWEGKIKTESS